MAAITLEHVVKRFGDGSVAVDDVSLDIADGEFMVIVGPSGCGKSTLLRMIVGLEDVSGGDVLIGGERVNERPVRERNLAMVFQNYALYPHLSVFENIAFPLRLRKGHSAEDVRAAVQRAAAMLELTELLGRKPSQLSGGQRQRVAMGRAIVRDASAFLFDEPLSNLDAKLRGQMRTEIARLQDDMGVTTVYVTHDQTEAMTLGDRVAVLRRGVLQQVASPRDLYEHPANLFVAGFIGSPPMNFLPAEVSGRTVSLPFASFDTSEAAAARAQGRGLLLAGIRPEHLADSASRNGQLPGKAGEGVTFDATVDLVEWLGNEQYAYMGFEAPPELAGRLRELALEVDSEALRTQLVASIDPSRVIKRGESNRFWFDPNKVLLFDPTTGENLTSGPA